SSSTPPPTSTTTGTVTTTLSDPSICSPPNGPFTDVWVTITKVTAHINGDAGPNDAGWVTLVDMTSAPKQIELFSLAQTSLTCVLQTLGSTTGLPPGNYQQIRVYLLANDNPVSGNACASVNANNCVEVNGTLKPMLLSSEAQTGIKIPSGQITSGGVSLQANQSADIDINFMACESLVMQGNGNVRLKPVLHAGEVTLNTSTLAGKAVDSVSGNAIPNALVLLEQVPSGANPPIEAVKYTATADSGGNFFFCNLAPGPYDVVIAATTWDGTTGVTYNPTVTLQVPLGSNLGSVKLTPETPVTGSVLSPPATVSGQITTTAATGATPASTDNTAAVVSLTALQSTGGGTPVLVVVPIFSSTPAPPNVTTVAGTTSAPCPSGTDCANYSLDLPGSNPVVGTFSSTGTTYGPPAASPAIFWILATALTPGSPSAPGVADCTPPALPATFDSTTQVPLNPGTSNPAHNIAFTGCTSGL
ncbi:MAG: DUF4382 domain-containing protein, partial [Acidobacteriia bacterium]|nr:DUF4382 domain-containing protein [Terriglobia bacterium]